MYATITMSFTAAGPGQLSFTKGTKIIIIDWNYGQGWAHVSSTDGKAVGIFPQAFIEK
jgi:hypothetical protein